MKISDIVRHKGDSVVTVRSDATVKDLLALLAEHKIGAIVVSDSDGSVDGIVSERDVVRHLHSGGAQVLDGTVGRIMTRDVHTCTTDDDLTDLAGQMTERRIRHVPVAGDHGLLGVLSIGDLNAFRADADHQKVEYLTEYIYGRS